MSHAHELAEAENLGYRRPLHLPPAQWLPAVRAFDVPLAATGMGPVCPFALAAPDPERAARAVLARSARAARSEQRSGWFAQALVVDLAAA